MPRGAARGAILCAAVALAAAGALSVVWHRAPSSSGATPLPDLGALPEFTLTTHRGEPFTRRSLEGSVWIADFIFTRCAGQCPMMTQRMAALQRRVSDTPAVRLTSISVDPSHDTPEALAAYARGANAGDRWVFLTGPEDEVIALSRNGFHLGVGKDGSPAEPVTHSIRLVLLDRAGHLRGYYDADDPQAMRALERDARHLAAWPR